MEENVPRGSLCCFCRTSLEDEALYGKMYKLEEIITHYFCVLLSAKVQQRGNDDEGILGFLAEDIRTEIRRGQSVNCSFCRKPGATIDCFVKKCTAKFHLPCGRQRDTLHQFFGHFKSFCPRHRKLQYIKKEVLIAMSGKESTCAICFDSVPASPSPKTIWAPCCSKEAWFHRICIQRLAISAGYFFKCPLCNNSDRFVESMRNCGIWVPDQDASWELETGRYEALLQRHNSCDAKICRCRHGRTFQMENTRWQILLCGDCGSAGIHIHCGNLRVRQNWFCDVCASVHTSKKQQQKRRTKSPICQEEHFKRGEKTALCIRLDEQENCYVHQEQTGKEMQQEKVPKKRNSDNIQDSASNARGSSFSSNDQKSSSRRTHSSKTEPDNDDSTVEIIDVEGDSSCEDSDDEVQILPTPNIRFIRTNSGVNLPVVKVTASSPNGEEVIASGEPCQISVQNASNMNSNGIQPTVSGNQIWKTEEQCSLSDELSMVEDNSENLGFEENIIIIESDTKLQMMENAESRPPEIQTPFTSNPECEILKNTENVQVSSPIDPSKKVFSHKLFPPPLCSVSPPLPHKQYPLLSELLDSSPQNPSDNNQNVEKEYKSKVFHIPKSSQNTIDSVGIGSQLPYSGMLQNSSLTLDVIDATERMNPPIQISAIPCISSSSSAPSLPTGLPSTSSWPPEKLPLIRESSINQSHPFTKDICNITTAKERLPKISHTFSLNPKLGHRSFSSFTNCSFPTIALPSNLLSVNPKNQGKIKNGNEEHDFMFNTQQDQTVQDQHDWSVEFIPRAQMGTSGFVPVQHENAVFTDMVCYPTRSNTSDSRLGLEEGSSQTDQNVTFSDSVLQRSEPLEPPVHKRRRKQDLQEHRNLEQLWRTKRPDPFTCTCKSNWRQDWSSNVQCPYRSSYSSCCCEWDEMYLYKSPSHSISGPENSLLSRFFSLVSKPGTSVEKGTYNMQTIHLPCGNGIEKSLESMRSSQTVPFTNIEKNGKLGGGQKYQKRSCFLTSSHSKCPYYLRSFKGEKERGMIQYFDEPKRTKETSYKSQDIYQRKISQGTKLEPGSTISENRCRRRTCFESKRSSSANNEHPSSLKRRSPDPRSSSCRRYRRRESMSPKRYSNCYGCSCSSRKKCLIPNHEISNQVEYKRSDNFMDVSALAKSPAFQPVVKLRRTLVESGRSRKDQYNSRTFRRSPIRTRSRSKHESKRACSFNYSYVAEQWCGHQKKYNDKTFTRSPIRTRSRSQHESERACSFNCSYVAEEWCGHREKYNSRTFRCSPIRRRSRSKQESERACSYNYSYVAEQWCGPQSSPSRESATDSSSSGEADETGWEDDVTEDTLLNIMKNVEVCFIPSSDKTLEKSLLFTKEGSVDFQSQSSLTYDDTSIPVSASDVSVNSVPTSSQLMSSPSSPLLSCSGLLKDQDCSSKSSLHAEIANHDHSYSIAHTNF